MMNQKQIELLCLGVSYLDMYMKENKDKECKELYDIMRVEVWRACNKNQARAIKNTELVCNKIDIILGSEEMTGNVLAIAIASLMVLKDENVFNMRVKRYAIHRRIDNIYKKLEDSQLGTEGFRNSMKLICLLSDFKQ